MLTAFQVLLYRYTGCKDTLLGVPIANRNRRETEGLIGFFVNMLPMRLQLRGDQPFRAVLKRARDAALTAYSHQDLPFEYLVEQVRPEHNGSRRPLFDITFGLQNGLGEAHMVDVEAKALEFEREVVRFDLSVWINDVGQRITSSWRYSTDLFTEECIARIHAQYCEILKSALESPAEPVDALNYWTDNDREREQASRRKLLSTRPKAVSAGLAT
jgi:non-ribosomal peptide synthetase component F